MKVLFVQKVTHVKSQTSTIVKFWWVISNPIIVTSVLLAIGKVEVQFVQQFRLDLWFGFGSTHVLDITHWILDYFMLCFVQLSFTFGHICGIKDFLLPLQWQMVYSSMSLAVVIIKHEFIVQITVCASCSFPGSLYFPASQLN